MKPLPAPLWRTSAAVLACALLAASAWARLKPLSEPALNAAESLYRQGVLPDGKLLTILGAQLFKDSPHLCQRLG